MMLVVLLLYALQRQIALNLLQMHVYNALRDIIGMVVLLLLFAQPHQIVLIQLLMLAMVVIKDINLQQLVLLQLVAQAMQ